MSSPLVYVLNEFTIEQRYDPASSTDEHPVYRSVTIDPLSDYLQALPDVKVAEILGSVMTSMFSLFAGFLISPSKVPGESPCSPLLDTPPPPPLWIEMACWCVVTFPTINAVDSARRGTKS